MKLIPGLGEDLATLLSSQGLIVDSEGVWSQHTLHYTTLHYITLTHIKFHPSKGIVALVILQGFLAVFFPQHFAF